MDDLPPQPDFPEDWDILASSTRSLPAVRLTVEPVMAEETNAPVRSLSKTEPQPVVANPPTRSLSDRLPDTMSYLLSPKPGVEEDGVVQMLTIVLRPTGDKARDVLRLRRIHGIITSYPGNDRFAFRVTERSRSYIMEFPNFTCGCLSGINQPSDLADGQRKYPDRYDYIPIG